MPLNKASQETFHILQCGRLSILRSRKMIWSTFPRFYLCSVPKLFNSFKIFFITLQFDILEAIFLKLLEVLSRRLFLLATPIKKQRVQSKLYAHSRDINLISLGLNKVLLNEFSACGGIRNGNSMPVLTAYFPVLAYLGKGWIVRDATTRSDFTWLTRALLLCLLLLVPQTMHPFPRSPTSTIVPQRNS